jgi:hypothetical protein
MRMATATIIIICKKRRRNNGVRGRRLRRRELPPSRSLEIESMLTVVLPGTKGSPGN